MSEPWGELITRDIELERPAEFLTEEVASPTPETWTFNGLKPDAVKALLAKNGLTRRAGLPPRWRRELSATDAAGTVLTPSTDFMLVAGRRHAPATLPSAWPARA